MMIFPTPFGLIDVRIDSRDPRGARRRPIVRSRR
jgi:hypothetical protein